MGRSNSRSHSSRSKSRSPSSSRSRSHSRKKRYSSRSRSRTYSRSRSRERVYNRDYNRDFRRDYRNNRGMRRPYGFRGRVRGYYQGGGGRYHRGGYRPGWNRRYSRSPRRGRSRSRSPKRRSASSQRSRSRSHRSYKSSQSPRSSTSRSSSRYSKSPVAKPRTSEEKARQKNEGADKSESPPNDKSGDEHKDAFDPSEPIDELGKELDLHGESWAGLSAYDNSPRSPSSPSLVASPPSQSSSQSDCPILSIVHSGKDTLSQNSHSIAHSPERSVSGSAGNSSTRYSPSQNSPLDIPSQKSPAKTVLSQHPLRDEGHSHYSHYADEEEQGTAKGTKIPKRYTDEEHRLFPIERVNVREKDSQKEKALEKSKTEPSRSWGSSDALDYLFEKEPDKTPFLATSENEEEVEDYRQFRKAVLADQGKGFSSASHWISEEEGAKYKSKTQTKVTKEGEKSRESKGHKVSSKDKHKDDDRDIDRPSAKKDSKSPEPIKSEKMIKDPFSYKLPLQQSDEVKENVLLREESPLRIRMIATESNRPEVKLRITTVPLDDARPSTLANDRLLASTLVHSVKRQKDFRSIFDHMKVPFSSKTSPESFIYHVVALVQFVKEHYFKGEGKTLNERFAEYQNVTEERVGHPKSPEIHRKIDLSPKVQRRQSCVKNEDQILVVKEDHVKVEKKVKRHDNSTDVRSDRKKEHSKERGESKCSRDSSDSRKREKAHKDLKESKIFKEESKKRKENEPSPLSDKDSKKETRDEEFKDPLEPKEYAGFLGLSRPRGTFFRIRGRGRARGVFAGTSAAPVNTSPNFQKRPKEEEWDPEYTPKSKKYFLHDDRDDGVDYWARRARGRGNFQRGRGRFPFKKSGSSPKWTHDKYQGDGLIEDEDEVLEDRRKEEKE
ncbi:PREDICTED: bcl-2-associated transcription factor 1 isoform X2 [Nanorana parkeri]|uniref:bcl-2-associated transcription factor 1 isoform X2 n=1 Tax=Nanorana parkeri TaxID=125878 RepID=UPI0008543DF0|nr:PREDICTED: bcl-2-associated transcription factor 1 isoform X2 [Nanorana parkeri]